ncbi:hypothetical protein Tco_1025976, partial [Tanacetum coccineum]
MTGNLSYTMNLNTSVKTKERPFKDTTTKLWFKREKVKVQMYVEDTMRIIKGRPFQERNNARGNVVAVDVGLRECLRRSDFRFRLPSRTVLLMQARRVEQYWMKNSRCFSDECDAFDSDVDEGPLHRTMCHDMFNLEDPIYDEAGQHMLKYFSELGKGVNDFTEASGSKPRSNTKKNRILPAKKENKKEVEVHLRTNKSVWTKVNRVDSSISSKRVVINSNSESVCKTCNKCLSSASHEMCVVNILNSVNATSTVKIVLNKGKQIWKPKGRLSDNSLCKTKRVWKATGKLFTDIGYQWRPTGKKFALGEMCHLTKLSVKCHTGHALVSGLRLFKIYDGKSFKAHEFCGKVHRGLGHNLFSVGQFCDSDLEVAFRKHTCFVRDIKGTDI